MIGEGDKRPFDMAVMNTDKARLVRRKQMSLASLPVLVVFSLLALWLSLPLLATERANQSLQQGNERAASMWLSMAEINPYFEQYKLSLNKAIVETHSGNFDAAAEQFRRAITLASDEQKCMVRVQAVLSSEIAGDSELSNPVSLRAVGRYQKALTDISAHGDCFIEHPEIQKRIEGKLLGALLKIKQDLGSDSPNQNTSPNRQPSPTPLEKPEAMQADGRISHQGWSQRQDMSDGTTLTH